MEIMFKRQIRTTKKNRSDYILGKYLQKSGVIDLMQGNLG